MKNVKYLRREYLERVAVIGTTQNDALRANDQAEKTVEKTEAKNWNRGVNQSEEESKKINNQGKIRKKR